MGRCFVEGLKHYVVTLPVEQSKINVNTIDEKHAPLMRALLNNEPSLSEVKSLIQKRPSEGWESFEDFGREVRSVTGKAPQTLQQLVDVKSQFFLLHIEVLIEERVFKLDSILHYDTNKEMKN